MSSIKITDVGSYPVEGLGTVTVGQMPIKGEGDQVLMMEFTPLDTGQQSEDDVPVMMEWNIDTQLFEERKAPGATFRLGAIDLGELPTIIVQILRESVPA